MIVRVRNVDGNEVTISKDSDGENDIIVVLSSLI